MRTPTFAYQGVKNIRFSANFWSVFNGWPLSGNMTVKRLTPQEVINKEEQALWWKFSVDSQARGHLIVNSYIGPPTVRH